MPESCCENAIIYVKHGFVQVFTIFPRPRTPNFRVFQTQIKIMQFPCAILTHTTVVLHCMQYPVCKCCLLLLIQHHQLMCYTGVISRGNAWERRSYCWKAAGTHGNSVPILKMFKNAQNSSQVEKKIKTVLDSYLMPNQRVVVQLTLTKIIKIVANRWRIL